MYFVVHCEHWSSGHGAQSLGPLVVQASPSHVFPAIRHRTELLIDSLGGGDGGGPGGAGCGAPHAQLTPMHCRRAGVTQAKPLVVSAIGTRYRWMPLGRNEYTASV